MSADGLAAVGMETPDLWFGLQYHNSISQFPIGIFKLPVIKQMAENKNWWDWIKTYWCKLTDKNILFNKTVNTF